MIKKNTVKNNTKPMAYDALLYAGLLEKFIAHIVWNEGITYTTDTKLEDSSVEFTEDDVKILQDIASYV
jgi:hypothetical protein